MNNRLPSSFFCRDAVDVARELPGKMLCLKTPAGIEKHLITEVEAYRGESDLACHASKGRTARTEVMYAAGGHIYVYLIYGMYWMLNFVTGQINEPQAVLIRGIEGYNGPGKLTRKLGIDKSYYGLDVCSSTRIWTEETGQRPLLTTTPRIGIDYAGEPWISKPWRFLISGTDNR